MKELKMQSCLQERAMTAKIWDRMWDKTGQGRKERSKTGKGWSKTEKDVLKQENDDLKQKIWSFLKIFNLFCSWTEEFVPGFLILPNCPGTKGQWDVPSRGNTNAQQ
jgi:hypothetical protein